MILVGFSWCLATKAYQNSDQKEPWRHQESQKNPCLEFMSCFTLCVSSWIAQNSLDCPHLDVFAPSTCERDVSPSHTPQTVAVMTINRSNSLMQRATAGHHPACFAQVQPYDASITKTASTWVFQHAVNMHFSVNIIGNEIEVAGCNISWCYIQPMNAQIIVLAKIIKLFCFCSSMDADVHTKKKEALKHSSLNLHH